MFGRTTKFGQSEAPKAAVRGRGRGRGGSTRKLQRVSAKSSSSSDHIPGPSEGQSLMTLSSDSEQSSKAPLTGFDDIDMADAGTATGGDNQDSQNTALVKSCVHCVKQFCS